MDEAGSRTGEGDAADALEARRRAEAHWGPAMSAAQAGDAEAYRKLLDEILPVVQRQVRVRIFDPNLAEDVVQNALLSIHRARHTYRPERPFGPWMRAVVRNAVIDALRERGRRSERETPSDLIDTWIDPNAVSPDARDEGLAPELRVALAALPAKQREAVELLQLEGLSVAEAALKAGTSPGALKVRAHRGYVALRGLLAANAGIAGEARET